MSWMALDDSSLSKRPRGTPTQQTPQRPRKRPTLREHEHERVLLPANENSPAPRPRRRLLYQNVDSSVRSEGAGSTRTAESATSEGAGSWAESEIKALVEFVLFHEKDDKWPCHKRSAFWRGAGSFIQIRCKTLHLRSGNMTMLFYCCIHLLSVFPALSRICLSIQGGGLAEAEIPDTC